MNDIKTLVEGQADSLKSLGSKLPTDYKDTYSPEILETFENKHPEEDYIVTFDCTEFTNLCAKTHQPDYAKFVISYIPDKLMVESKSLKLYLFSFRNTAGFHEPTVNTIKNDLVKLLNPKYIEVFGIFAVRGGIAIHPFATHVRYDCPQYLNLQKQRQLDRLRDGASRVVKYDI